MDLKDLKGSDELAALVAKAYEWAEHVRLSNIKRVKAGLKPSTKLFETKLVRRSRKKTNS